MLPGRSLTIWFQRKAKARVNPRMQAHQSTVVPKPNLNPDEQLKAAQARVVKLEAATMALGDTAVAGLREALAKARAQAQLGPVQDRIAHTETFLDRSWKTGGRWSTEALQFVEMLAAARAREAPRVLRRSARTRRWSRLFSVSCGTAFANSLVSPSVDLQGTDGPPPELDLFQV